MELHKCQFFNYAPSAVQAIAFSADGSRVAVARADADIEIWNVQEDWLLEKVRAGRARMQPRPRRAPWTDPECGAGRGGRTRT